MGSGPVNLCLYGGEGKGVSLSKKNLMNIVPVIYSI